MNRLNDTFSNNLRLLLVQSGLSQKELAKKMGCSTSLITRYLSSERLPSTKTLSKIASVFGIKASDMLEDSTSISSDIFIKKKIRTQVLEVLFMYLEREKPRICSDGDNLSELQKFRLEVIKEVQNELIDM